MRGRKQNGKKKNWELHNPVYECDRFHRAVYCWSPWAGLRNFAYDYLCFMRPRLVVELGAHYGCSSFAFLQAIKDQKLPTLKEVSEQGML